MAPLGIDIRTHTHARARLQLNLRQFFFLREISAKLERTQRTTCAGPESFVSGDPNVISFFGIF